MQCTSRAYYFARKDTHKTNRTVPVMNALGYDGMVASKISTDTRVRAGN